MLKHLLSIIFAISCTVVYAGNEYTNEYGVSKILPASEVFPKFHQGTALKPQTKNSSITVVVASTNQIKRDAAEQYFSKNVDFNGIKFKFILVKAGSDIAEQPIGINNGIFGAANRIENAKKIRKQQGAKLDVYYVAIENFFTNMPENGKPTDHAAVIIETPDGKKHIYISDGVEICRDIYSIVVTPQNFTTNHSGTKSTIGEYLAYKYRIDKSDWFSFVTDKPYSRQQQILSAFKFAMPKINEKT